MEEKEKKSFFSRLKKAFKGLAVTLGFVSVLGPGDANAANVKEINLQELSGDYNAKVTQASPVNNQTATKVMADGTIVNLSMDKNNPVAVINETKDTVNSATKAINGVENIVNGRGNIFDNAADVVKQVEKVSHSQILNNPENKNEKSEIKSEKTDEIVVTPVEKGSSEIIVDKSTDTPVVEQKVNKVESEPTNKLASNKEADAMVDRLMHIYEFDRVNKVPRSEEEKLSEVIVDLKTEISAQRFAGNNSLADALENHRVNLESRRQELTLARLHLGDPADHKSDLDKLRESEKAAKEANQDSTLKVSSVEQTETANNDIIVDNVEESIKSDKTVTIGGIEETVVAGDAIVVDGLEKAKESDSVKDVKVENKNEVKVEKAKEKKASKYPTYSKKEKSDDKKIYSWEEINQMGSIGSILDSAKTVKSTEASVQDVKADEVEVSSKKSNTNVSKSDLGFTENDLNALLDADAKKSKAEYKVDETKLNKVDISADQMGTMETLDDEQEIAVQKKEPGVIDESKLADVSMGQMGVLEEDEVASREEVMAALKEAQATGQRVTDKRILAGLQKMRVEDAKKKQGLER